MLVVQQIITGSALWNHDNGAIGGKLVPDGGSVFETGVDEVEGRRPRRQVRGSRNQDEQY